jgi:2-polyprenyl-3-methyl-5-hydroxy-6-metoxy-1,4-benzoquinol methylase
MEVSAVVLLDKVAGDNWWYMARRRLICKTLGEKENVLEMGCGVGDVLVYAAATLSKVTMFGMDNSEVAIHAAKEKIKTLGLNNAKIMLGDVKEPALRDGCFDAIICADVLEHLTDDKRAVLEAKRILKSGGELIVTVPAYMSLWSKMDEECHHLRRYDKKMLERLLAENGFRITSIRYWNSLLTVPVFLYRRLFNKGMAAEMAMTSKNKLLNSILYNLLLTEEHVRLPFGVSLIARAVKL